MSKWWSVSWKRVGIALLLVFGSMWVMYGVAALIFHQMRPWLTARELARINPQLNLVPMAPADESQATLTGVRLEFYKLSFQTPWKDIARERASQGVSFVNFNNGETVMVFDPAQDLDRTLLGQLRANHTLDDETLRSGYNLRAAEMDATSDQVKWWRTPSQNFKHLLPLTMKLSVLHGWGALYSVGFGEFHGFQEGNPSIAPYEVVLDLFDGADHHYTIVFSKSGAHQPFLAQAQINSMIASLRSVPEK